MSIVPSSKTCYFMPNTMRSSACFHCCFLPFMKKSNQQKTLVLLVGFLCLGIGAALLAMDIIMIAITPGPEYIPAYLVFQRTASDTNIAGRWIFTAYFFAGTGLLLLLYDVIRRFFIRFRNDTGTQ